ncbi:PREDICTED: calcineurin-binding protein cabin-1-like isoform X1 [Rhagoletis zephyria]|uniref:calcineurin-binding protein cabin-1-like isoform X1 n=1 Tax=Rhagoletis zephyria TaxID=28612 RepID=UPI000811A025|nr:PREDICTED: calcineurin-binding protein cabin-1-like isoform X1 [Rhagoletis zephyria]
MMRIVALNEECSDEPEDQIVVTREAQEAIAEAEYIKAINLKFKGDVKSALSLLSQLLETQVLNELLAEDTSGKLRTIRYNCHKNIAFIHEERNEHELALENYIMATQLDDTDVYTLHRFGQLALKLNAIELAEYAFERCLRCNASHWSAADGMLRTLCENHNIIGAYGYALKLYSRDPSYERAAKILYEISEIFKSSLPLCENMYGPFPKNLKPLPSWTKESAFPRKYRNENKEDDAENMALPAEVVQKIRVKELSWVSVGQYIVSLYRYMQENGKAFIVLLELKDILAESKDCSNEGKAGQQECNEPKEISVIPNSNSSDNVDMIQEADINCINAANQNATELQVITPPTSDVEQTKKIAENSPDEAEAYEKTTTNSETNNKPKPRRRCSDLHFLEQWGWHKNRRYSSRKKVTSERVEVDTSLKGVLRKIFVKYADVNIDEEWPFGTPKQDIKNSDEKCEACSGLMSNAEFQEMTSDIFTEFVAKIEAKTFDPSMLVFEWLKCISSYWTKGLPLDIRVLYLEIFCVYLDNFDCSPWNQQSVDSIDQFYRISVLFLELDYTVRNSGNNELSPIWKQVFDQLAFRSGTAYVALGQAFNTYKLRLVNIEFLWFDMRNELEKCIACLENMANMISVIEGNEFILHLPNLRTKCITKNVVQDAQVDFKRRIALGKVPKLFEQEKWQEVVNIITDNLSNDVEVEDCDNWVKNFKTQVEILLQSLWNMSSYEECLKWAEKCLHFCIVRYVKETDKTRQQELWSVALNYIYSYIEVIILNEGNDIVSCLDETLARLVQNTICVLSFHLDSTQPIDKSINPEHEFNMNRAFVVLHQIMLRDENNTLTVTKPKSNNDAEEEEEPLPCSFSILFTAHDFLGKFQCCTRNDGAFLHYILDIIVPIIRAPLYDSCRDTLYEYLEQVTFCLYGYPQKKARSRHLEDHEATNVELTWAKAVQAFDLYRPECLPEINSYKLESITADLEQFFLKIVALMPSDVDPSPATTKILEFIKGNDFGSLEPAHTSLPYKIRCIFYLLADYYFKNRDFSKAIKYYTLDLTISPTRFDSWAGIALSKASKIETRLNGLTPMNPSNILAESEDTIRCFEMCICLNRQQTLLWIEYGSFTYTLHSYCSRQLKRSAENLTAEQTSLLQARKGRVLNITHNCFSLAAALQNAEQNSSEENEDSHEEKWLCQYMLGKIAEKQKDHPKTYLNFYLKAANNLYESNATYPIKINHSNPTTLSVEALEIFYRTNASIIKYLEHQKEISRDIGNHFSNVLKSLASSPFAFNKAKIDGNSLNALKRKVVVDKNEQSKMQKTSKKSNYGPNCSAAAQTEVVKEEEKDEQKPKEATEINKVPAQAQELSVDKANSSKSNPSRRESEESGVTVTTTTITSSTTSITSGTDSSSSDSDSDSDGSSNDSKKLNTPYPTYKVENIYKIVVQNLEECVTRFPEHYKSIYRLAYHYKNTSLPNLKNLQRCEELMMGQYKTSLENQINGVFYDRKWNNIFNGIWRIPSSEIDRPGNFASHLIKCTTIVIDLLYENKNHKLLVDIGLQLYKTPEQDKRYIKDCERVKLSQQNLNYCAQIMRDILKQNMENRNDVETLNLLIDIYKVHKKCLKYMNQKESLFTDLMVDVYKFYIQNKVDNVPENLNFLDLAIKLCLHEIAFRRNQEKVNSSEGDTTQGVCQSQSQPLSTKVNRQIHIPGLTMRQRGRSSLNKSADSGFGTESMPSMSGMPVPTSTSDTIWHHLLRGQLPSLDMQQILDSTKPFVESKQHDQFFMKEMLDQYKAIFQSMQNDQIAASTSLASAFQPIPTSTIPLLSTMSNLTTIAPNPVFLSASLPIETTITPAISKHTQETTSGTFTPMSAAQAIANYDITITPFCNINTSMPRNLPIVSTVATNSKPIASVNPTDSSVSQFVYNASSATSMSHMQQTNFAMAMSGQPQAQNKPKGSAGVKVGKQLSVANAPIVNPLATFGCSDLYNHQMQILMNLMQDANNTFQQQQLPQQQQPPPQQQQQPPQQQQPSPQQQQPQQQQNFSMPTQQKPRAATKRKAKQQNAPISAINSHILPNAATTTTPIASQMIKQESLSTPTAMLSENHPLFCPSMDANGMAINQFTSISLGNTVSSTTLTNALPPVVSAMQQTTFTQPQTSPQPRSGSQPTTPTKTLQQKLAERKKANQQNESMNLTNPNSNTNTEIIILD